MRSQTVNFTMYIGVVVTCIIILMSSTSAALSKPMCGYPKLIDNNVTLVCTVSSVFTSFTCRFSKITNIGDFKTIGAESQSTLSSCSNSPPVSCDSQCTLTVSVSELGAGFHRFKVSMSKDGNTTESDSTAGILLWYPEVRIINCPDGVVKDGYIKQGTVATCECERTRSGYPPGRPQWVLPDNTEVQTVTVFGFTKLILHVMYDVKEPNPQLYHCQGSTPLPPENNPNVTFSPKFAYGPSNITEFNVSEFYNLCPSSNPISVTCNIEKTIVNPEPVVVLKVPGMNDIMPISKPHTLGTYNFQFSFTPQTGQEKLGVTCQANNSKFAELSATAYKEITVRAPPTKAPMMSIDNQANITNGQVVNVTEGQSVQVRCNVQGGFPSVTNVTITCGSHPNIKEGTHTSLNIDVNRTNNKEVCTCTAEHPTGCYKKSTSFTFNVQYGPDEVQATLVSPPVIKLCPSKREAINMVCQVPIMTSGLNPKPRVVVESLGNDIQTYKESQQAGHYVFHYSFIPNKGGNLTTTCVASNPKISSIAVRDSKMVTVLEPPPSAPSMALDSFSTIQNGQKVNVTNGQTVQVQCGVQGGFPPVTKVLMTCAGLHYETGQTQLTQSITLNKTNNNDVCSCSAVHSSECYDLNTTFTFNVQYASRVTNYTVITPTKQVVVQDSSLLKVDVGTIVTFVCEGEGNPKPDIKVKSQKSIIPIPSQVTSSGSYRKKAVATKTMACKDTAFYVCEASNGIAEAGTENLLVTAMCTPELPEEDKNSEPKTYTYNNGTDLEIEIRILGQPPPDRFFLTKKVTRTKRSTDSEEIEFDRYNATYTKIDELYGQVTLVMYGMTDRDKGQYELNIQNGIGHGLTYSFYVDIESKQVISENDDDSNTGAIVGVIVAVVIVVAVAVFVVLFLRHRGKCKRKQDGLYENDKPGFNELMTSGIPQIRGSPPGDENAGVQRSEYVDVDSPPSRPHYEKIDDNFLPAQSPNDITDARPSNNEYLHPVGHQESKAKSGYQNVTVGKDIVDTRWFFTSISGYVNERSLPGNGTSTQTQQVYENLKDSHCHTPGYVNERYLSGNRTSTQTQHVYENLEDSHCHTPDWQRASQGDS